MEIALASRKALTILSSNTSLPDFWSRQIVGFSLIMAKALRIRCKVIHPLPSVKAIVDMGVTDENIIHEVFLDEVFLAPGLFLQ